VANVCVIGAGYVGLSCGACLSHIGHRVVCVDIDENKIDQLNAGQIPIMEPGLTEIVSSGLSKGFLSFTVDLQAAISKSEYIFLCLPTPQADDGSADLSILLGAVVEISKELPSESVLITKSTVPIGTFETIKKLVNRSDVHIASNPEFVREGYAVHDFLNPDRIVVGSDNPDTSKRVVDLFNSINSPVLTTDLASAEAIKHAANSFLAVKLSYINAIAIICELYGADVLDVVEGLGFDSRIGKKFLNPGPGWGGSCFPKDTSALIHMASSRGYEFPLLREAINVNIEIRKRIINKVITTHSRANEKKRIAIWGLTFKANTDDLRDSPAIEIVKELLQHGAQVRCFDPAVHELPLQIEGATLCNSAISACENADVVVLLTEWAEFALIDPSDVASRVIIKKIIDCRNLLDRDKWLTAGFEFQGLGR